jgi:hypothetical protein
MGLAITSVNRNKSGNQFKIDAVVTFDDSYPTGGETINASSLGLNIIDGLEVTNSGGYAYDTIIASSGGSALIKVYYSDYNATGDGAFIEVPNTTNISTLATKIVAYGK